MPCAPRKSTTAKRRHRPPPLPPWLCACGCGSMIRTKKTEMKHLLGLGPAKAQLQYVLRNSLHLSAPSLPSPSSSPSPSPPPVPSAESIHPPSEDVDMLDGQDDGGNPWLQEGMPFSEGSGFERRVALEQEKDVFADGSEDGDWEDSEDESVDPDWEERLREEEAEEDFMQSDAMAALRADFEADIAELRTFRISNSSHER